MFKASSTNYFKPPKMAEFKYGHPLIRGLIEYWLINEGLGVNIYSIGRNTLFTSNFVWNANAIKFPGSGGTGSIISNAPTADFTVHVIVRPDTNAATQGIWNIGGSGNVRLLSNYNGGIFGTDVAGVGAGPVASTTGAYGVFNHVTLTGSVKDGTKIYVNGALSGSSALFWSAASTNQTTMYLGTLSEGFPGTETIRLFLIYNRVLNPQEIIWLYREPYVFIKPKTI